MNTLAGVICIFAGAAFIDGFADEGTLLVLIGGGVIGLGIITAMLGIREDVG